MHAVEDASLMWTPNIQVLDVEDALASINVWNISFLLYFVMTGSANWQEGCVGGMLTIKFYICCHAKVVIAIDVVCCVSLPLMIS